MAVDLDTSRRYYSMRSAALEQGDYYSTIKNQTFQQNSFFTFSSPRQVLRARTESGTALVFDCKFYLPTDVGALTLFAGEDTSIAGTWTNVSLNGTGTESATANPWRIEDDDYTDLVFTTGYNLFSGTFVLTSGTEAFSLVGYWESTWKV